MRIIVFIPKHAVTGGPQALHQFVFEANKIGIKAKIAYYEPGLKTIYMDSYINEKYHKYEPQKYLLNSVISNKDYLIFPEVEIEEINNFKGNKCFVWWLSIDNAFHEFDKKNFKLNKILTCVVSDVRTRLKIKFFLFIKKYKLNKYNHLVQSYYAMEFLDEFGLKSSLLQDYIDFIDSEKIEELNLNKKEDIILYNPSKGLKFTELLKTKYPNLNWIPLVNCSHLEIRELLCRAKVYIDLGHHPGKDRFPREAALHDCVVITSKSGSAKNTKDIAIPFEYKFSNILSCLDEFESLVEDIFKNHSFHLSAQKEYKREIQKQHFEFVNQVRVNFGF
jgi:hypothetical protein